MKFRRVRDDLLRSDSHEIWRYEYPGERTRYVLLRLVDVDAGVVWNFDTADEAKRYADLDLARKEAA